jgi:hypothetical protein
MKMSETTSVIPHHKVWLALAMLAFLPVQALALPISPPDDKMPAILTAKPPGSVSEERAVLEAQYKAFAEQVRARYQEFSAGRGTSDILFEGVRFLERTGLQLVRTPAEEIDFCEKVLDLVKRIEEGHREKYEAGRIALKELETAYNVTLEAEIQLLKAKRKAKSAPTKAQR